MAYKFICGVCGEEEILRKENIYAGRSPESVAEQMSNRHQRLHDVNDSKMTIKEGGWDDWHEEFVEN